MAGLEKPILGDVIINGASSKALDKKYCDNFFSTNLSFVSQDTLIGDFSLKDNLKIALRLQGKPTTDEETYKILEKFNLLDYADLNPSHLSSGKKWMAAMALALVKDPKIVLINDLNQASDDKSPKFFEIVKDLSKDKLVIVFTYNKEWVKNFADRIIEINEGKIVQDIEINSSSQNFDDAGEAKNETFQETIKEEAAVVLAQNADEENIAFENDLQIQSKSKRAKKAQKPQKVKKGMYLWRALKIGAGGIKAKPVLIFITILFTLTSFISVALSHTIALHNSSAAMLKMINDWNIKSFSVKRWRLVGDKYRESAISDADIEILTEATGLNVKGVYSLFCERDFKNWGIYKDDVSQHL